MRKLKKSLYTPIIIFIYFNFILYFNASKITRAGETWRLVIVIAVELLFLILLYFTLRKKEKNEEKNK